MQYFDAFVRTLLKDGVFQRARQSESVDATQDVTPTMQTPRLNVVAGETLVPQQLRTLYRETRSPYISDVGERVTDFFPATRPTFRTPLSASLRESWPRSARRTARRSSGTHRSRNPPVPGRSARWRPQAPRRGPRWPGEPA